LKDSHMKKIAFAAAAAILLAASPAGAKDISLSLNEQEQAALAQVLDQATRSGGLAATQGTVYFYNKLQQAIAAANAPAPAAAAAPEARSAPDPETAK
jgi:hypothetical protein